jgi:hypothetical protein
MSLHQEKKRKPKESLPHNDKLRDGAEARESVIEAQSILYGVTSVMAFFLSSEACAGIESPLAMMAHLKTFVFGW